jgi:hypothetical protein
VAEAKTEPKAKKEKTKPVVLGYLTCPVCEEEEVALKQGGGNFPYINHDGCCQIFVRGGKGAEALTEVANEEPKTKGWFS